MTYIDMIYKVEEVENETIYCVVDVDTLITYKTNNIKRRTIENREDCLDNINGYKNKRFTLLKKLVQDNLTLFVVIDTNDKVYIMTKEELLDIKNNITNIRIANHLKVCKYGTYNRYSRYMNDEEIKGIVLNGNIDKLVIGNPIYLSTTESEHFEFNVWPKEFAENIKTVEFGDKVNNCVGRVNTEILWIPSLPNLETVEFKSEELRNLIFYRKPNVQNIIVNGLINIRKRGLKDLKSLKNFSVDKTDNWDGIIPESSFRNCSSLSVDKILKLNGVKEIHDSALDDCCCDVDRFTASDTLFYISAFRVNHKGNSLDVYFNNRNIIIDNLGIYKFDKCKIYYHICNSIDCTYYLNKHIIKDIIDNEYNYTALKKLKIFNVDIESNPKNLDEAIFIINTCSDRQIEELLSRLNFRSNIKDGNYIRQGIIYILFNNNVFRFVFKFNIKDTYIYNGNKRFNSKDEMMLGELNGYRIYKYDEIVYSVPIKKEALINSIRMTYSKNRTKFRLGIDKGIILVNIKSNYLGLNAKSIKNIEIQDCKDNKVILNLDDKSLLELSLC